VTLQVAEAISAHPGVEAVLYPGLPSHPQYSIAKKQMHMFGGMMSLLIRGGQEEAVNVVRHLKLLKKATSLGGTESLIEHRRSTEP
jgi:cystathionine gamma-synthase